MLPLPCETKNIYCSVMVYPLVINVTLSVLGFLLTMKIIPAMREMFINAGLKGKDIGKPNKPEV